MLREAHVVSLAPRPMSAVPRAVWIGGAVLGLVGAAAAGALVMRSMTPAPTPLADASVTAPASLAAAPVPPAPLVAASPAKPVPHAGPVTAPGTSGQSPAGLQAAGPRAAVCASCGTVESVTAVQQKGQGTGLGVVAGGVLGGVVGHQVGGGNGKTAMTVLGAIGGGLAGNEVEKRARGVTTFDVRVRMQDGSTRVFHRTQSMAVGTRVVVDGSSLRVAHDSGEAPGTLRTSAPADGNS
jgi:outer membrane lipoprotein SlyB